MTYDPSPLYGWSQPGCHYPISRGVLCGQEGVTVDGINGRRCELHPPEFDPDVAVALMVRGLPGAAGAYIRSAS